MYASDTTEQTIPTDLMQYCQLFTTNAPTHRITKRYGKTMKIIIDYIPHRNNIRKCTYINTINFFVKHGFS